MATRSYICLRQDNRALLSIYCHWDGYPEGVGKTLANHYTTREKVEELMKLGDLSSLGEEIGYKHDFDKHIPSICKAYGRDRGETNVEAKERTLKEMFNNWAEYIYIFNPNISVWECIDSEGNCTDL